ncbi:MAG: hypothetical protein MJE77_30310 [Proteobacteria bacterium]|nr:hypothetical protein [Pseudomonadota bacterium]
MALAGDRIPPARAKQPLPPRSYPVQANAVIHADAIVALENGKLRPASDAAGLQVIGIALEKYDNTGGPDDAAHVMVGRGQYRIRTSTADGGTAITAADVGNQAVAASDEFVVSGGLINNNQAGEITGFEDPEWVWVDFHRAGAQ